MNIFFFWRRISNNPNNTKSKARIWSAYALEMCTAHGLTAAINAPIKPTVSDLNKRFNIKYINSTKNVPKITAGILIVRFDKPKTATKGTVIYVDSGAL